MIGYEINRHPVIAGRLYPYGNKFYSETQLKFYYKAEDAPYHMR
jgi:hypothetical protein